MVAVVWPHTFHMDLYKLLVYWSVADSTRVAVEDSIAEGSVGTVVVGIAGRPSVVEEPSLVIPPDLPLLTVAVAAVEVDMLVVTVVAAETVLYFA